MTTQPPVDTKKCEYRKLTLSSLDDLSAELDRIQAAHDAGTLAHTGNWTPGQILEHCTILWKCALDGFPPDSGKVPFLMRLISKLLFKRFAVRGDPPPRGIKLPQEAAFLIPPDDTTFEQGMASIRDCIARVARGDQMTHPSPLFGKMRTDQWLNLHLGHCRMHLGYLSLAAPN